MNPLVKHHPDDIILEDGTSGYILKVNRPLFEEELLRGTVAVHRQVSEKDTLYSETSYRRLTAREIKTKKTPQLVYLPYRIFNKLTKQQIDGMDIIGPPPNGNETNYSITMASPIQT
jgi:hypothetical protein